MIYPPLPQLGSLQLESKNGTQLGSPEAGNVFNTLGITLSNIAENYGERPQGEEASQSLGYNPGT